MAPPVELFPAKALPEQPAEKAAQLKTQSAQMAQIEREAPERMKAPQGQAPVPGMEARAECGSFWY